MQTMYKKGAATVAGLVLSISSFNSVAESGFQNHSMEVTWELWSGISPGQGGDRFLVKDTETVNASNDVVPDITDLHSSIGNNYELWNIDFEGNSVVLEYNSIYYQLLYHEYMYGSAVGIHIKDADGSLPAIESVSVDSRFSPFGFNPNLVSFDEDNIWIDLNGSMCHYVDMGSMPSCTNPDSPSGYDNLISLSVSFAEGSGAASMNDRIDTLFDWAEVTYTDLFPSNQTSMTVSGYYLRFYPETGNYLGVLDGVIYVYSDDLGGLYEVSELEVMLNQLGL